MHLDSFPCVTPIAVPLLAGRLGHIILSLAAVPGRPLSTEPDRALETLQSSGFHTVLPEALEAHRGTFGGKEEVTGAAELWDPQSKSQSCFSLTCHAR